MKLHEETARLQLLTENESNVKTLLDRTMTSAGAYTRSHFRST